MCTDYTTNEAESNEHSQHNVHVDVDTKHSYHSTHIPNQNRAYDRSSSTNAEIKMADLWTVYN